MWGFSRAFATKLCPRGWGIFSGVCKHLHFEHLCKFRSKKCDSRFYKIVGINYASEPFHHQQPGPATGIKELRKRKSRTLKHSAVSHWGSLPSCSLCSVNHQKTQEATIPSGQGLNAWVSALSVSKLFARITMSGPNGPGIPQLSILGRAVFELLPLPYCRPTIHSTILTM